MAGELDLETDQELNFAQIIIILVNVNHFLKSNYYVIQFNQEKLTILLL